MSHVPNASETRLGSKGFLKHWRPSSSSAPVLKALAPVLKSLNDDDDDNGDDDGGGDDDDDVMTMMMLMMMMVRKIS